MASEELVLAPSVPVDSDADLNTISRSAIRLQNLLSAAQMVSGIGKTLPFPFVQGAFEAVEVLLERIALVKTNQEELRLVAQEAVETMQIVTNELSAFPENQNVDERFRQSCVEFTHALTNISTRLQRLSQNKRGFRRITRRYFEAHSIQDEISATRVRILQLKSNFTLASVVGTRAEVSVVNRGVNDLQKTVGTTHSTIASMHSSMHDRFEHTHGQLDLIHESIKSNQSSASSPQWNLETHDNSQGHLIQNGDRGTFVSSHGAIIITRPPRRRKGANRGFPSEDILAITAQFGSEPTNEERRDDI